MTFPASIFMTGPRGKGQVGVRLATASLRNAPPTLVPGTIRWEVRAGANC